MEKELAALKTEILDSVKAEVAGAVKSMTEVVERKSAAIISERGEKRSFAECLKGIYTGNEKLIDKYGVAKKDLAEGTGSAGGYLVPDEFSAQIVNLIKQHSIIRPLCKVIPCGTDALNMPTATGKGTTYWLDENAQITKSDIVFGNVGLTPKKLACLTLVPNELLKDSKKGVSVDQVLFEIFAAQLADAEDLAFLYGAGGAGDPITGIYNLAGINSVLYSGNLIDDIADALEAVEENDGLNCKVIVAPRDMATLRKAKDDNGDYIYAKPEGASPATIWEYPIMKDLNIPKTLGGGANQSFAIVGDFDNNAFIGDNMELEITADKSRYFEFDQVAFRGIKRVDFRVAKAARFARVVGITK